jgi:hypothetical protein
MPSYEVRCSGIECCGAATKSALQSSDGIECRRAATKSALQSSSGIECLGTFRKVPSVPLGMKCRTIGSFAAVGLRTERCSVGSIAAAVDRHGKAIFIWRFL